MSGRSIVSSRASRLAVAGAIAMLAAGAARADEKRFVVVDVSQQHGPGSLTAEVGREVARLRPGWKIVDEGPVRTVLETGEAPEAAFSRLVGEAEKLRAAGDCEEARRRASEAESVGLLGVGMDEERDGLKTVYSIQVACADKAGQVAAAREAMARLRGLVSMPPSALGKPLWEKYAIPAGAPAALPSPTPTASPTSSPSPTPTSSPTSSPPPPSTPVPSPSSARALPPLPTFVELAVDSDPPNGHVAVDFHGEGVTPRTLKVASGVHIVEVEKEGYKKAFRRVVADKAPIRIAFRLIERTHDRADQALAALAGMRGVELQRRRSSLARIAQLARADFVVALVVEGGKVKIWFFDAERGDLGSAAIESAFDPVTGRVDELGKRETPAAAPAPPVAAGPAPAGATAVAVPPEPAQSAPPPAATGTGLPEAESKKQLAEYNPQPWRKGDDTVWGHWYSWVIAAGVIIGVFLLVRADEPKIENDLDVRAHWGGPK